MPRANWPVLAIDGGGGDNPSAQLEGAALAACRGEGYRVRLYANPGLVASTLADVRMPYSRRKAFEVVNCALHRFEVANILDDLKAGRADAWLTATNSQRLYAYLHGAGMLLPQYVPGLLLPWPTRHPRGYCFRTDGGMSSKMLDPDFYYRLALGAKQTLREVYGLRRDLNIGLLNVASERGSGALRAIDGYLRSKPLAGYVGFTEPADFYDGRIDLQLGDGFDINVLLKELEAVVPFMLELQAAAMVHAGLKREFGVAQEAVLRRMGYDEYLASRVTGVERPIYRVHGGVHAGQVAGAFRLVAAQLTDR
jgi:fatty acid/phospholipid biosynthesis enzyme